MDSTIPTSRLGLNCGCKGTVTHRGYLRIEKITEKCDTHRAIDEKLAEKTRLFETFPSEESHKIYNLMDEMINTLQDHGVDVSYFPEEAYQVVKDYAIKISNLEQ